MPRINKEQLVESAMAKMPSGWIPRDELEVLLTPDEVKAVAVHTVMDRNLIVAKVKPMDNDPLNLVLQYKKVEGGA